MGSEERRGGRSRRAHLLSHPGLAASLGHRLLGLVYQKMSPSPVGISWRGGRGSPRQLFGCTAVRCDSAGKGLSLCSRGEGLGGVLCGKHSPSDGLPWGERRTEGGVFPPGPGFLQPSPSRPVPVAIFPPTDARRLFFKYHLAASRASKNTHGEAAENRRPFLSSGSSGICRGPRSPLHGSVLLAAA